MSKIGNHRVEIQERPAMTQYVEDFEEGQACPLLIEGSETEACTGTLQFADPDNCSCHISAPCSPCLERPLVCNVCHWEAEDLVE